MQIILFRHYMLILYVSNCNLTDLWKLNALETLNDESKIKIDSGEETQKYFLDTVKHENSGRFQVSLSCIAEFLFYRVIDLYLRVLFIKFRKKLFLQRTKKNIRKFLIFESLVKLFKKLV